LALCKEVYLHGKNSNLADFKKGIKEPALQVSRGMLQRVKKEM
jgi:hypothetical protein